MSSSFERDQTVSNWAEEPVDQIWQPRDGSIELYCGACGSYEHSEWVCPQTIKYDAPHSDMLVDKVNINYDKIWVVSKTEEESPLCNKLKQSCDSESGKQNAEMIGDYILQQLQQYDGEINADNLTQQVSQALNIDPVIGSILVYTSVSSDARLKLNGRVIRKAKPAIVPLLHEVTAPLNDIGPLRSARRMRKYEDLVLAVDGTVQSETEYFQHSTIATLKRCLSKCESIRNSMTPRTPKQDEPGLLLPPRLSARSQPYTPRTPKYFHEDFNESDEEEYL